LTCMLRARPHTARLSMHVRQALEHAASILEQKLNNFEGKIRKVGPAFAPSPRLFGTHATVQEILETREWEQGIPAD
jgi:hypothetical protein